MAAWICALGGRARLIAARGSDLAAGLVAAHLARWAAHTGRRSTGRPAWSLALRPRHVPVHADRPGVGSLLAADALAD